MSRELRILLVEDDEAYAAAAAGFLEIDGHTVDHIDNAPDAVAYLAEVVGGRAICHGVVVDYNLDNGDPTNTDDTTRPVIDMVRDQLPHLPMVGYSGIPMDQNGLDTSIFVADVTKDYPDQLPVVFAEFYDQQ